MCHQSSPTDPEQLLIKSALDGLWKPLSELNDFERSSVSANLKVEAKQELLVNDVWSPVNTRDQASIDAFYDLVANPANNYTLPDGVVLDDSSGPKKLKSLTDSSEVSSVNLTLAQWDLLPKGFRLKLKLY